jgi:hypothetical protein
MISAVVAFAENDRASCLDFLHSISSRLRGILGCYFDNMNDSQVSRTVWMSYVQGVEAWAAGRMISGEYVEYDGLSGNHVLFFQVIDAFLGMDRYLSARDFVRYVPARQRNLCNAMRKHSFCRQLDPERDAEIMDAFVTIVNQLKASLPALNIMRRLMQNMVRFSGQRTESVQ